MTKKKITGTCEVGAGWHEDASGHPLVDLCGKPARFYKGTGPFSFGLYLCDEHKELA